MIPGPGIFRTQLPNGFLAGGINCGVRHYRPDLGIIISEKPCIGSGVFTQNTCKAAPVKYCKNLLPANNIKVIITNSGEANAATGLQGIKNNQKMVEAVAKALTCNKNQILTASTGVIGKHLSVEKIVAAIPSLTKSVSNIAEKFATSILTTDLVPKTACKEIQLSEGKVSITGICKGSGMIHPNMATMLGYLLTDAQLTIQQSETLLKAVCNQSFNMVSVDGETSTNDSVFMLSNGASGVKIKNGKDMKIFYDALLEICITLAKSIARDGEGASKLIQITVSGVKNGAQAKKLARSLSVSPLIKTAIYGESPNWGRILARIGSERISEKMLNQCDIFIQGIKVFSKGAPSIIAEDIENKLKEDTTEIVVNFSEGKCSATAWSCDLTEKYVKINAEYIS